MTHPAHIALVSLLASCAAPYHAHMRIEGEPTHVDVHPTSQVREPDTAPPAVVIDRTLYHIDHELDEGVLSGWSVTFRDGETWAHCDMRTIYVDADSATWRDDLAHEVGEAYLCEMGVPKETSHLLLRALGACYGWCEDLR